MARLNTRPALAGVTIGAVAAIAIVLLPSTALESIVSRTHLAEVMSAAQPPLGLKARLLLGLIPLFLASAIGLALGLILGAKKRVDPYGDYGAYTDYDIDTPVADPFAPQAARPVAAPAVAAEPVVADVAPEPSPVFAPVPTPPPVAAPAPLDGATSADLAEIADAVVRLNARLDSIEAKLEAKPAKPRARALPADLVERLDKIGKSLDAAG